MVVPMVVRRHGSRSGPHVVQLAPSVPPLVPVFDADDELTPEVDRVLTAVAQAARDGDVAARNALFAAYQPKIARFARRYSSGSRGCIGGYTLDPDDLSQEAYVVFAEFVAGWQGGDSFGVYFLGNFPWALRNAVRRLTLANRRAICFSRISGVALLADDSAAGEEALALLQEIATAFPEPDGTILLWRIRDGERISSIARRLGLNRRTVERAWDRIVAALRRSLMP
jgi:RNA polymerase sigma factor (sigma-70 family)